MIFGTLVFIFTQSVIPPEQSAEQSDKVGDILEEIITPETPVGGYVQNNVRKIAHFVEFAFLGLWVSLYVFFFLRKWFYALSSYAISLITALFDETIQIFSGRGPDVVDVWIDFAGYASSFSLVCAVLLVANFIILKRKQRVN